MESIIELEVKVKLMDEDGTIKRYLITYLGTGEVTIKELKD